MSDATLQATGLSYAYRGVSHNVFDSFDLDVCAGSMLAVLGNNGAGKSTLLDAGGHLQAEDGAGVGFGGEPACHDAP